MTKTQLSLDDCMAPNPYTVDETDSVAAALQLMEQHQIRHLPVLKEGKLVGLLSMRDVQVVQGVRVDANQVIVKQVMSPQPYAVERTANLREVALMMMGRKYGSAVVTENGTVVGVFTTVDAMRVLANLL